MTATNVPNEMTQVLFYNQASVPFVNVKSSKATRPKESVRLRASHRRRPRVFTHDLRSNYTYY